MYSDMSILIMLCSSSNRLSAKLFASSVFPTPVGPKNRNEPIGFLGSLIPALDLIIASDTSSTASSCPITLLCNISFKCKIFSLSPSISFVTGIPVHFDTIFAISSSVTLFLSNTFSFLLSSASSFSSSF